MGRIIPIENKKCLKPPTRYSRSDNKIGSTRSYSKMVFVDSWRNFLPYFGEPSNPQNARICCVITREGILCWYLIYIYIYVPMFIPKSDFKSLFPLHVQYWLKGTKLFIDFPKRKVHEQSTKSKRCGLVATCKRCALNKPFTYRRSVFFRNPRRSWKPILIKSITS